MPTYGDTSAGASWTHCELRYVVRTITIPGGESVVGFNAYLRSVGSATSGWKLALWDKTDDSLDYESDNMAGFTDTTGAWRTATYSGGNPVADTYWLGVVGEGVPGGGNTIEVAMDTITADTANYLKLYYTGTWPTLQNPLPTGDDDSGAGTHDVSIYLETAAAGGTVYTRTLSDSLAMTDAPVRGVKAFRQMPQDNAALLDALARGIRAFRQMPQDNASAVDALVRSKLHGRVTSDQASLSDAVLRAANAFRRISDDAPATDTASRFVRLFRRTEDDVNLSDALAVTLTLGSYTVIARTLQDSISANDALLRFALYLRKMSDSLSLADILAVTLTLGGVTVVSRILQDSLNVEETVLRAVRMYRREADVIDAQDSVWHSQIVVRQVIDTLSVAETAARAMMRTRIVTDPVEVSDLAFRYALLQRVLHDDAEAHDNLASQIAYYTQLIGFVLQSLRAAPIAVTAEESAVQTGLARDQPIHMEMRNL